MSSKREWLIQIRKARGIKTTDIIKQAKITSQMYYCIENNKRNPSVKLARKIAEILDFDWILFYSNK